MFAFKIDYNKNILVCATELKLQARKQNMTNDTEN